MPPAAGLPWPRSPISTPTPRQWSGPLATFAEPHSYDLCEQHALGLTVPRGWEVLRHEGEFPAPIPQVDDLLALADAVREAARPDHPRPEQATASTGRRGHLRVVPPTL